MIELAFQDLFPRGLLEMVANAGMVESVLDDIATSARRHWQGLASRELHTSRQTYREGIQEVEAEPGVRFVRLEGKLPNWIEGGLEPFDMKAEMLPKMKNRRQAKDGHWYGVVPFRHGTPGSSGLAGSPMGSAYGPAGGASASGSGPLGQSQSAQFGLEVYRLAKAMRGKEPDQPRDLLTEGAVAKAFRGVGGVGQPLLKPHHQTSIYAGMRRERKPYTNPATGKTTTQSSYYTFRTISENSNPDAWLHPGIQARHLLDKVVEHVRRIAPAVIGRVLRAAVTGRAQ
jgi:hypothetical protein